MEDELYWKGPPWLASDRKTWPHYRSSNVEAPEKRESKVITTITNFPQFIELKSFSSLKKLIRVFALIRRFINALKNDRSKLQEPLTAGDLSSANFDLVSLEQKRFFTEEISLLNDQKQLPRSSNLRNLTPFYDPEIWCFESWRPNGQFEV